MKRNGLVFVPREPPKRVILYPSQDSTNQQTNGFPSRPKTAITTNNRHEINQQSNNNNNNNHLSRQQQTLSSLPTTTTKSDNVAAVPNTSVQATSSNTEQKTQNNPPYANPFFRPKVIPNLAPPTTNTNNISSTTREPTIVTANFNFQTVTSATTTTRTRQPVAFKPPNSIISSNTRTQESETTVTSSTSTQDDNRRWAHAVASAPGGRRAISDERPNGIVKPSELNTTNTTITTTSTTDFLKQKGSSATDIVISLMDTWRAPITPPNSSGINIFTRLNGIKDDSAIPGQTLSTGAQLPSTPPFLTISATSAANNTNQNWKKALVANFQKNSRNIPTAKLFQSRQQPTVSVQQPPPPPTSISSDLAINQQQKTEKTVLFNGLNSERTFQVNENIPVVPSLIRKSAESLRVTKQDNNNNIERTASLQVPSSTYSNPTTSSVPPPTNETVENNNPPDVTSTENIPQIPIPIPSTLITPKPPVSVEQQRAIITRVMIRRDFVKSNEPKPVMPTASNIRSLNPSQSAKPGGLPTTNLNQTATITENNNVINSTSIPQRIYPFQQQYYQQQQTVAVSQKSLITFTTSNSTTRESFKNENNSSQLNGLTNDNFTSSSMMKMQQTQMNTNNSINHRTNSLSAASVELRRKKEEFKDKAKKRAASAAAIPNDG